MKSLSLVVTHFNSDKAARLNVNLLNRYRPLFYQELLDLQIILLTTGSTLYPGVGEDIFINIPNKGHHKGDLEMFNLGVGVALAYGADFIAKFSANRVFLNGEKLLELLLRLTKSDQLALGDHWCNVSQLSTDVCFMKKIFAEKVFPLPIDCGTVFSEQVFFEVIRQQGLLDQVIIFNERQPIHCDDGRRRTNFYKKIELLTNCEENLAQVFRKRYPSLLPLLDERKQNVRRLLSPRGFDQCVPKRTDHLVLAETDEQYELRTPDGLCRFVLNDSAAFVWSLCDGKSKVDEIKATIAETFSLSRDRTDADVQEALEAFIRARTLRIESWAESHSLGAPEVTV